MGALLLQKCGCQSQVQTRLFWGKRMQIVTGEVVSRGLLAFGYSEPDLTALVCELLPAEATAIDIGTHFGYEAMLMAELVGPRGCIHAFEPNPEVRAIASRNLRLSPQVKLHACALGDHTGRAVFNFPPLALSAFGGFGSRAVGNAATGEVSVCRLDDVPDLAEAALIKCDAEGNEDAIMAGADRILAYHPSLILETGMPDSEGRSPNQAILTRRLEPVGYHPFAFRFDGSLHIAPVGAFPAGHANTLFLHETHARFALFKQGWSRRV